jgi:hypothetical protein
MKKVNKKIKALASQRSTVCSLSKRKVLTSLLVGSDSFSFAFQARQLHRVDTSLAKPKGRF